MLGAVIHASCVLTHLTHTTNLQSGCYDPHFPDEETATPHVEVIHAKSHSYQTAELGYKLSPSAVRARAQQCTSPPPRLFRTTYSPGLQKSFNGRFPYLPLQPNYESLEDVGHILMDFSAPVTVPGLQ